MILNNIFVAILVISGALFNLRADLKDIAEVAPGVTRIDRYDGESGYYLFVPTEEEGPFDVVVFAHGFGALNPATYGGWIEHLVRQGNAVVYVRYQEGIFSTATTEFVPNTTAAIRSAFDTALENGYPLNGSSIDLIGHSYGGVIAANIAANWSMLDIPKPRTVLLCEPGSGPLSGGVLESYEEMDRDLLLAIVVGDDDSTVGQSLGVRVLETAINTPNRVLFWQYADEHGEEEIGATHYEPYSYDERFDNGISNFTVRRSASVSRLDAVDMKGYWQIYDTLDSLATVGGSEFTEELLLGLANLGEFSDGTPIRAMEVIGR